MLLRRSLSINGKKVCCNKELKNSEHTMEEEKEGMIIEI